jgi:hypothetical protein
LVVICGDIKNPRNSDAVAGIFYVAFFVLSGEFLRQAA